MASRTYGDKPISFQLEENGEWFCIGSEVIYFPQFQLEIFKLFIELLKNMF